MELPGGFVMDGVLQRSFGFRPVTGALELRVAESALEAGTHPARVTAVLLAALEYLGDTGAVSASMVWDLSVGDRQFLMRKLAAHLDDRTVWLSVSCTHCDGKFDVPVRQGELPVKPAGENYPESLVKTSLGVLRIRVPTGADQEAVASIADDQSALKTLVERIARTEDGGRRIDGSLLSHEEIAEIEARVEDMAPEITSHLLTRCPLCEHQNRVPISPYTFMERPLDELFEEIHQLAFWYHWSEQAILDLPRSRRRLYLGLIDRSRGLHSRREFLERS